ncbi:hypothetical protein WMY93_002219 [Mugilogobius chulae]|uniref:Receptor activity modifying protein 1 n=1 Tax=Mugilogobius chulae TaxID=88201 RepID=A0AAW0PUR1_9GOBI
MRPRGPSSALLFTLRKAALPGNGNRRSAPVSQSSYNRHQLTSGRHQNRHVSAFLSEVSLLRSKQGHLRTSRAAVQTVSVHYRLHSFLMLRTLSSLLLLLCFCCGVRGSGSQLVVLPCDRPLFEHQLELCLSEFNQTLERSPFRQSCVWPNVKPSYYILQQCVEHWSKASWCNGVGSLIDRFFMNVHVTYFSECGRIKDPPVTVLLLMVAPLILCTLVLPVVCVRLTTKIHN